MPFLTNLYEKAKERNILTGLIIVDLITFISYAIFHGGLVWYGDIQMTIGCIIGVRFALKHQKSNKSLLKYGILTGIGGALLAVISMGLFDLIIFWGIDFSRFFIGLSLIFLEAIIIGLIIGTLIGYYYHKKRPKIKTKEDQLTDEFFDSLK